MARASLLCWDDFARCKIETSQFVGMQPYAYRNYLSVYFYTAEALKNVHDSTDLGNGYGYLAEEEIPWRTLHLSE